MCVERSNVFGSRIIRASLLAVFITLAPAAARAQAASSGQHPSSAQEPTRVKEPTRAKEPSRVQGSSQPQEPPRTQEEPTQAYAELPNFHKVNARLYRGAQPRAGGMARLAALGVKTIINLRDNDARALEEEREARGLGLRYFNVPISRAGRPSDARINELMSIVDAPRNQPVFVHCKRGADRTGAFVAIYRITHDGWTGEQALEEANRYGLGFWQRGKKDFIKDYYRDHAAEKR